jgi:D-alanyl-D-alanine carboxypeptidase/D-alanyl-D-alanine-endopeptidase (penicillin-binding protein 4)
MRRVLVLLLMCLALPALAQRSLPPEVEQALTRERVPLDALAVVVQEVGVGTTHVSLNAQQPVNPASLAKLLHHRGRARPAGPGLHLVDAGVAARPRCATACSTVAAHQGRGDPKLVLERLWLLLRRCGRWACARSAATSCSTSSAFVLPDGSPADFDGETPPLQRAGRGAAAELQGR